MQFDYEIPVEEYAAGQVLYYKVCAKGRLVKRALSWVLLGLLFVLIAASRWVVDWAPILLLLTGALFIYWGIVSLFPRRHYRRHYPESGLAGTSYHAELDEHGFSVKGDGCSWRVLMDRRTAQRRGQARFNGQWQGHDFHIWEEVPNR